MYSFSDYVSNESVSPRCFYLHSTALYNISVAWHIIPIQSLDTSVTEQGAMHS